MKNPFKNIFKFSEAAPTEVARVVHLDETGSSGTRIFSGYAQEEYLQQLRGRLRADIFDQMRRSDPQIKMCLSAVKNPIKSATWEIEAADDSPEAQADKELIEQILFKDISFKRFLSEALTVADFGHAVFEIVHKITPAHPKFGAYVGLKKLAWRSPRTIERWNKDPETKELASISQYAWGDGNEVVDIPAQFLLLFNIDQEGDNFEGVSLIRPCYGCWKRKDNSLKLNAIGIEKFAIPTPTVEVPSSKENTTEFSMMKSALERYTSHQSAYLMVPQGWTVTLSSNTYDPQKVEVSIDNEDKRIAKAFLANFLELGSSGSGSWALSTDLSDFFLSGLDHLANEIEEPINLRLIPELVKANRGERAAYPKLKHSGVSDKAGKELADVVKLLVDSRIVVADDQLESNMRSRYNLPKATKEGQRQPATPAALPAPTLAERIKFAEEKRRKLTNG